MYETCPSCHAIAQPEWDRCRICGADLSAAAREAAHRRATAPPPPPSPEEERDRKIAYTSIAVTGIVLALGFAVFLVINANSGRLSASELEDATSRVVSPLPPVPTTDPGTTTSLPRSDAAESLGVILPANPYVVWQQPNSPALTGNVRSWAQQERLTPVDVDVWEGRALDPEGPDVTVAVITSGAGQDVRTEDYMRHGIAEPGYEITTFTLAGRPVAYVPASSGRLAYLFGVTDHALVYVEDDGDASAADLNKITEAFVYGNP